MKRYVGSFMKVHRLRVLHPVGRPLSPRMAALRGLSPRYVCDRHRAYARLARL